MSPFAPVSRSGPIHGSPTNWTLLNPGTATFADVPVGSTYFTYVETGYAHGILGGYACGSVAGEPCPGTYYRPGNQNSRAQVAKMLYQAVTWPPQAAPTRP